MHLQDSTTPGLLGVVGGMTWRATSEYHRLANELTERRLGSPHSAQLLIRSLDFAPLVTDLRAGHPDRAGDRIVAAARQLERAGAELILLAANTAHRWYGEVTAAVRTPVLHIAEPVRRTAERRGLGRLGVLGTGSAADVYTGLNVVRPGAAAQQELDELIMSELAGRPADERDLELLGGQVRALCARGAEAIVLGCTDFSPLAGHLDGAVPVLDSTALHVEAAIERLHTATTQRSHMHWQTYSTGSTFEKLAPFSRAVHDGEWIYVSGTTGFDYTTMTLAEDAASQVRQTWLNVRDALRAVDSDLDEIVQYLMVLTDPADLPVIGEVMNEVLPTRPAGMAISAQLVDPRLRYEVQVTARRGATVG